MNREDVIRRIVERQIARRPLERSRIQADQPALYAAAGAHFGTWETALRYAGVRLPRPQLKYSQRLVLRHLRRLCMRGECLAAEAVRYRHRWLYAAAKQRFDTWRAALLAAGINPQNATGSSKRRLTDKQEILQALRAEFGKGLSTQWPTACRANRALAQAAKSAFSTWRRALLAVGRESSVPTATRQQWNEARVLEMIQLRRQNCQPLNYRALRREAPSLLDAGRRYFGNWNAALAAAGLPVMKSTTRE